MLRNRGALVGAGVPDVEQCIGDGEEDGAEDDADGAEEGYAAEDREQDGDGVGAQVGTNEDRVEDVVDGADDESSPDGEEGGFSPVAVEAEVDGDRTPDEEGAEGWDHGAGGERGSPEDDTGNSEDPEGESGEDALNAGDGEAAERGGEDGFANSLDELVGLVVGKGKESTQRGDGDGAVAEEEEEDEEHDDELRDHADGVAEQAGNVASEIGCGAASGVVDVDGAGEGFDARGEFRAVGDEAGDLVLVVSGAEGPDKGECLFADLLREEECRDDDRERDEDQGERGAEGRIFYFCREPVVGVPGDDGENNGSDDGGEEGLEEKTAEDQDADGYEEESDLLPWNFLAAILHQGVAPFVDWMLWLELLLFHHSFLRFGYDSLPRRYPPPPCCQRVSLLFTLY